MGILYILFVVILSIGGLLFLSWLADKHPPVDVDAKLRAMKQAKEDELQAHKRSLE